ncbi:Mce-associated membrane protein [Streptomyces sp. PanSC19]|uniref:hypothetical protein n=1 Tax=Streptomyces sp. PanSC19 TaxID=1520455 RepID=UPI000F4A5D44|nr:hypothetical protein [Streptomyces sp. PanSC19]ROQ26347.1 Mce-associated membrane protein [Streptomyces sp. PanSC19]
MPTPRHHLNRQRRRQALADQPVAARAHAPVGLLPEPDARPGRRPAAEPVREAPGTPVEEATDDRPAKEGARGRAPLVVLCVLTLLLGGFAGWAHSRAGELRDDPARGNTALTDLARTSEIKGQTTAAVAALFSYDHADTGPFERAGKTLLTGKAVEQHRTLFAGVLAQAARQKTVITTTVTDSAVERIDGDRARVLVYADQSSVSTAGTGKQRSKTQDQGVYAGAMFALDVVRRDGRWLVENIDTFGR